MIMAHFQLEHNFTFFPLTWKEVDQVSNVKLFSQTWRVMGMLCKFIFYRSSFLKRDLRLEPIGEYCAETIKEICG